MSAHCHNHDAPSQTTPGYKLVLWIVMLINLAMFFVEISAGLLSNSTSLLADSLDFAGDAATYGISIFVLNSHLHQRAKASMFKAAIMALFGLWVLGTVVYQLFSSDLPQSHVMGMVGVLALVANLISAFLLYRFREGDSNMLSVWLCTRNDAIGNIAVLLAALGVYVTNTAVPDLIVASIMGFLGLSASIKIFKKARIELNSH